MTRLKHCITKHATKFRYLLIGTINTAIDFGILFMLTWFISTPKELANIISTTIAFAFSFVANRSFTFRSRTGNVRRQLLLFTLVTLFGLWVIQTIIITLLAPIFISFNLSQSVALLISKLIATIASLIWNYLLYTNVVFKDKV